MRLLCLHGFLGRPSDFDFLKNEFDVIAPNLNEYVHLGIEELYQSFKDKYLQKDTHILGYSFGARLGCQLYLKMKVDTKLVCLGGHLGIENESELNDRLNFETNIVKQLSSNSHSSFLDQWNKYDLFSSDADLINPNFLNAKLFFELYGLSIQPYMKNDLLELKENIHFFYGNNDVKYRDYALNELAGFDIEILDGVGHRILQHPEIVLKKMRNIL